MQIRVHERPAEADERVSDLAMYLPALLQRDGMFEPMLRDGTGVG